MIQQRLGEKMVINCGERHAVIPQFIDQGKGDYEIFQSPKYPETNIRYFEESNTVVLDNFDFRCVLGNSFSNWSNVNIVFSRCLFSAIMNLFFESLSLSFYKCTSTNDINISLNDNKNKLSFNYCNFSNLIVMGNGFSISEFKLNGLIKGDVWEINNIESIKKFEIRNLLVETEISLTSLQFRSDSVVKILNSSLKNMNFIDIDFSNLMKVIISGSDVSSIITNSVHWDVNKISVIETNSHKQKVVNRRVDSHTSTFMEYRRLSEVHRQLKTSMKKQGNTIYYLLFRAEELKNYNLSLPWKMNTIEEKIQLSLSNLSSKYGQSWLRPMFLLFLLSTLLVFSLYLSMPYNERTAFHFKELISVWIEIMKPTAWNPSNIRLIEIVDFSNLFLFIWILWKIIYFILSYQFIISFRKFNK